MQCRVGFLYLLTDKKCFILITSSFQVRNFEGTFPVENLHPIAFSFSFEIASVFFVVTEMGYVCRDKIPTLEKFTSV